MKDKNDKSLQIGDVIDIHQTVNGENIFIILNLDPLDVRYRWDRNIKYEYNKEELLKPDKYTGEVDWEIVGNINENFILNK